MLNSTSEELMSIREAANYLHLAEKTIYNRKGDTAHLRRVQQGRRVKLIRQEVVALKRRWIEEATKRYELIYGEN